MLNSTRNRMAPKTGVLKNSTIAPDTLPVCKPLQGKEVCCQGDAWTELKANFGKIKERFSKFVKRRKERIEKIEKDLSQNLVEEVSDILNDNQAMVRTDAFKMKTQRWTAEDKKDKDGKRPSVNIVQKKEFDSKGWEVCKGEKKEKEECKKRIEKKKEALKKYEETENKKKADWIKKNKEM